MTDKVTPLAAEFPAQAKEDVLASIAAGSEVSEALKLVAQLKVVLLADVGANGGLNKDNRRRAWKMVADLGIMLMEKDSE